MEYAIIAAIILVGTIYFARRKAKQDEEAREAQFRAVMLGLEEKAKREGTFVVSYFDTGTKK